MSFEFLLDPFTEFHCRGTVRHSLKSIQQRLESLIDPCAGACGVKFLKHSVQMAARCVCVVFEWKAHDFRKAASCLQTSAIVGALERIRIRRIELIPSYLADIVPLAKGLEKCVWLSFRAYAGRDGSAPCRECYETWKPQPLCHSLRMRSSYLPHFHHWDHAIHRTDRAVGRQFHGHSDLALRVSTLCVHFFFRCDLALRVSTLCVHFFFRCFHTLSGLQSSCPSPCTLSTWPAVRFRLGHFMA